MKTKNSKLALIPAISAIGNLPATQPPPRKADIICALVERARVKHEEESQSLMAKRTAAEELVSAAIVAEFEKNPKSFQRIVSHRSSRCEIELTLRVVPPHITKLIAAKNNLPQVRSFDPAAIKRDITAKLSGGIAGDRVKALLASPDAVKKLDATLEALSV